MLLLLSCSTAKQTTTFHERNLRITWGFTQPPDLIVILTGFDTSRPINIYTVPGDCTSVEIPIKTYYFVTVQAFSIIDNWNMLIKQTSYSLRIIDEREIYLGVFGFPQRK